MSGSTPKQEVRSFYDQIGWRLESDGFYQNARYEDLRPVSAEYIHNCHLRVTPWFKNGGKFILDAGCGPIQYKEYLTYSENFEKRVCADISFTALIEARKRIGDHGLFVVCDVANLPFVDKTFDGVVSLHTLHHLSLDDQKQAWIEIYRVMKIKGTAVIVNGWTESKMMQKWLPRVQCAERAGSFIARLRGKETSHSEKKAPVKKPQATGTYIQKLDSEWIQSVLDSLGDEVKYKILCWRSVSVRWLRALIHNPYGRAALRHLQKIENENPEYYGAYGQYPMIVVEKEK